MRNELLFYADVELAQVDFLFLVLRVSEAYCLDRILVQRHGETGFNLFSTTSDGYLVFNGTRVEVGVDMTRFDFVFDFEQGIITLYVDGVKTGDDFAMPYEKYAETPLEYKALYDSRIYNWRRQGTQGEAVRIGALIIREGDFSQK